MIQSQTKFNLLNDRQIEYLVKLIEFRKEFTNTKYSIHILSDILERGNYTAKERIIILRLIEWHLHELKTQHE